jgi:hypothetical protein
VRVILKSFLAVLTFGLFALLSVNAQAQQPAKLLPDAWLTNASYPGFVVTNRVAETGSGNLSAEALVGKLRVYWAPPEAVEVKEARLWMSADVPGVWLARDWQMLPLEKKGQRWEGVMPVENPDVPVAYFVEVVAPKPMITAQRICHPRVAGLEEPSRIFWPFREGFEEDLWSWRLVTDEPKFTPVETATVVKSGKASLKLALASDKHSVTVATTKVRGWQLDQNFANGIRVWVKLAQGTAKLRCTLLAHAFTPKQVISVYPDDFTLTTDWQPVDLKLSGFPKLVIGEVDLMTLELIGNGPIEAYVDNVQFLGRWIPVD